MLTCLFGFRLFIAPRIGDVPGMHDMAFLVDLILVFGTALLALVGLRLLKLPPVVGLILAGMTIGPHGLALVKSSDAVEGLAEIGVALLLFSIGLEFSLRRLWRMRWLAIGGGGLQVLACTLVGALSAAAFGASFPVAMVAGFAGALSSTAIILKSLGDQDELDTPHGRLIVTVALFQDLAVVPMTLALPLLAGIGGETGRPIWRLLASAGILVVGFFVARRVVPKLLDMVAELRSREAYLLAVAFLLFGVSYGTLAAGLSLALGAFLAGIVISDSRHRLAIMSEAIPFRDLFTSLFFISVGMLVDVSQFITQPVAVASAAALVLIVKSGVIAGVVFLMRFPQRTALTVGLGLGHVGEFSFLLLLQALSYRILTETEYQLLLGTSVLTMVCAPFVLRFAPRLAERAERLRQRRAQKTAETPRAETRMRDHVVVLGYGLSGRNLARVLRATGIPYAVLELNARTVREEEARGEHIHFGDASRAEALEHLDIRLARVVVLAINDLQAVHRTIEAIRRVGSPAQIIARTRYVAEIEEVLALGAHQVVAQEFESSIEIFSRVLRSYGVAESQIRTQIAEVRGDHYRALRDEVELPALSALARSLDIASVTLNSEAAAIGRTLVDLDVQRQTGALVVAVLRASEPLTNFARTPLAAGDALVLAGKGPACAAGEALLRTGVVAASNVP
ncbi:MAG: cation:proton antiporter [Planctomycetota bacterium]